MPTVPPTQYARNGPVHLAYQVLGSGSPNLVVVSSGPGSHMDHQWDEPHAARWLRQLGSFARLVMYDNRGTGLSDPVSVDNVPTMDQQVDDLRVVMDATGCDRAVIAGHIGGCAPAMVFAATRPERVEKLILMGGYARLRRSADYPYGVEQDVIDMLAETVLAGWGTGDDLPLTDPSMADDEEFKTWYAQMERLAASPGAAAAMARQWFETDVRSVLATITAPTLVIGRAENALYPPEHAKYLAEHIAGARYVEIPGSDLHFFTQGADVTMRTVQEFITGTPSPASGDRFLGTVLFVDVVDSTRLAVEIGDARFRTLIQDFHELLEQQLARHGGRLVDTAGDGALSLFDSPARAIECAESLRTAVRSLGFEIRAGVHTGEMERGANGEVRGIAVHIGARVAALAGANDLYVSRTIRDLMAGAQVDFESRGTHELKGVPGRWEIFAVAG
ncbi:MAG: adenylate/guanylate cyclase domain-containing protein [Candidatus Dormibacteria bacterium]